MKYTDDQIQQVISMSKSGKPAWWIIRQTGISKAHVYAVLSGKWRKDLTGGRAMIADRRDVKYTDDEVREVVRLYKSGLGVRCISHQVEMSESGVEQILEGRYRTDITGGRLLNGYRADRSAAAKRGHERRKQMLSK